MTPPSLSIDVFYVAFQPYGPTPIKHFMHSYCEHPAGLAHRLTVALKGFASSPDRDAVVEQARLLGAAAIDVPNRGFDIGTYLHVAATSEADTLCFLNSNSEILADEWLGKLVGALRRQGGGAVAATGSLESHAADQLRVLPGQAHHGNHRLTRLRRLIPRYGWFPNAHLRTNALAIDRVLLLGLGFSEPRDKDDAWLFESGRQGLSASILRRGGLISVVGADGRAFAPAHWASSDTFWQGEQRNLLVADNQTRRFQDGDLLLRNRLSELAWHRPRLERHGRT